MYKTKDCFHIPQKDEFLKVKMFELSLMTSHTYSCSFSCSMEIVWHCLCKWFGDLFLGVCVSS